MQVGFDYQSVCHCTKTLKLREIRKASLITSQFVTAPKRKSSGDVLHDCLITSQFVTAPKHDSRGLLLLDGLITSQFVTAPKHARG